MLLGRPVKLVVARGHVFQNATFLPKSRHRIELGADPSGKISAIRYDADHQASRAGQFEPDYYEHVPQMYGVVDYLGIGPNFRIDTQEAGYMRWRYSHPAAFALESAVDELAYQFGEDPIAFRLKHHASVDPLNGKPMSS